MTLQELHFENVKKKEHILVMSISPFPVMLFFLSGTQIPSSKLDFFFDIWMSNTFFFYLWSSVNTVRQEGLTYMPFLG